jgi:hypothetical protein
MKTNDFILAAFSLLPVDVMSDGSDGAMGAFLWNGGVFIG